MKKISLILHNITIINRDPLDTEVINMEPIAEENNPNDPIMMTDNQNESKKDDFEVTYNDFVKLNAHNNFDRRIEHGSEIDFSINRYTTRVTFEFSPDKNSTF